MSLLTMIQDAVLLLGIADTKPSTAISTTDTTYTQLVALLQEEGDELARTQNWRFLKTAGTITGDGATTLWSLPSDFERLIPDDAFWSTRYPAVPLGGPVTDAEMLALKALPVTPVRPLWRFFGTQLEIWPALAAAEVVNYTYFSNAWIVSSAVNVTRWVTDADTARLPENILTLGLKWRWRKAKGFDFSMDFAAYKAERDRQAGQSGGARTISLATSLRPDGIWGPSPINPIIVT